jgi:hypothetical protein
MKSELKQRTLQSLADAYSSKQLRVNSEYQRGTKWIVPQKQALIDSLLRGYQIPLFYVHLEARVNDYTREVEKTAWLVDGQQRLDAIDAYRQTSFHCQTPRRPHLAQFSQSVQRNSHRGQARNSRTFRPTTGIGCSIENCSSWK